MSIYILDPFEEQNMVGNPKITIAMTVILVLILCYYTGHLVFKFPLQKNTNCLLNSSFWLWQHCNFTFHSVRIKTKYQHDTVFKFITF